MAAIKVAPNSRVKVKADGRIGTVIHLTPQKNGGRGRPVTIAHVVHEDATEGSYGVRDLKVLETV